MLNVAMLDLNLNGHPRYAVADALVAQGVPFVFSTSYSNDGMREDYRDRLVLRKSCQPDAMAQILDEAPSILITRDVNRSATSANHP